MASAPLLALIILARSHKCQLTPTIARRGWKPLNCACPVFIRLFRVDHRGSSPGREAKTSLIPGYPSSSSDRILALPDWPLDTISPASESPGVLPEGHAWNTSLGRRRPPEWRTWPDVPNRSSQYVWVCQICPTRHQVVIGGRPKPCLYPTVQDMEPEAQMK